jgi:hypothetical protein
VKPTPIDNGRRTPFYHVKRRAEIEILLSSVLWWLYLTPGRLVASLWTPNIWVFFISLDQLLKFLAAISTAEFWVNMNNGNTGFIKFRGEVKSRYTVYQSVFLRVDSLMPRTMEENWQWSLLVTTAVNLQWELWKETVVLRGKIDYTN